MEIGISQPGLSHKAGRGVSRVRPLGFGNSAVLFDRPFEQDSRSDCEVPCAYANIDQPARYREALHGRLQHMKNQFNRITSREALDDLIRQSTTKPVVLFKHSITCPLSADAYQEMERMAGEVALIEVQRNRDLSQEIEQRTKVVHETPQVLVLRHGKAVWHQSHWKVTADEVLRALEQNR